MKQLFPMTLGLWVVCSLFLFGCRKEKVETPPEKSPVESVDETQEKKESDTETEKEEDTSNEQEETMEESGKESDVFRALTNGVLRGEKEITVREFHIPTAKADSVYHAFLRSHPLLFHLKVSGNIGYRVDLEHPEYLAAFLPQYAVSPTALPDIYPRLEESIESFYALLDHRMSPAEVAYTLYQKVCQEVVYGERNEDFPNLAYASFSALGVFLTHKAVCQGYSLSYSLLMNGLGIPTDYVTGAIAGTSGHAWNRIYLDGNWYHADATFDDASSNGFMEMGSINKYFLCSDNLFYTAFEHARPHTNLPEQIYAKSGNRFDNENCVIRRYDAKGEIIKTEAMYADGYWYYLSMKDDKMKILKSDFEGQHAQLLRQQNVPSSVGNVDKLQYTKDRIYFLDIVDGKYSICSMDYEGNDFRQERKVSFIEASSKKLKLSQENSRPTNVFYGRVALQAECMLARLRLLYFHGEEDYFHLSHPQAVELKQLIEKVEAALKDNLGDDRADVLAKELREKRKMYSLSLSVRL